MGKTRLFCASSPKYLHNNGPLLVIFVKRETVECAQTIGVFGRIGKEIYPLTSFTAAAAVQSEFGIEQEPVSNFEIVAWEVRFIMKFHNCFVGIFFIKVLYFIHHSHVITRNLPDFISSYLSFPRLGLYLPCCSCEMNIILLPLKIP